MENSNKLKKWELALIAGLLVGQLSGHADAAQLPLSRWQIQNDQMRYQVVLFPFGFAEAEEGAMAETIQIEARPYEIRFRLLEWLEDLL